MYLRINLLRKQVYKTSTQIIDPTADINMDACLVALLCPTLWEPKDCSPPGSSVHGTLQARTLQWVPFPPPGDLSDPGTEPEASASPALAGRFFASEPPGELRLAQGAHRMHCNGWWLHLSPWPHPGWQ